MRRKARVKMEQVMIRLVSVGFVAIKTNPLQELPRLVDMGERLLKEANGVIVCHVDALIVRVTGKFHFALGPVESGVG